MNAPTNVRVRFAPSPTGYLHVGGLRTALYNYLFAAQSGGTFILRIEDTDRTRFVPGAVENLIATLRWAGLDYQEGPDRGGSSGPYVQSERLPLYLKHAEILLQRKQAYRCFCTPQRLEEMRKKQEQMKISPKYDRTCLRLTDAQVSAKVSGGEPSVVRLKVPDGTMVRFHDIIREWVEFESDRLDDQVLLKSDGYPTYHLANVVDDHFMGITHVIRGEEWLSSTPKHVVLYAYFGWKLPEFAHLPLLLNPDRSKLSKRQGDVAVEEYRAKGYLRDALVNFVALLGWNPGTEQELFTMNELIRLFSLDRVNKAGAIFNLDKLNWLNFEHLRKTSDDDVVSMVKAELLEEFPRGGQWTDDYIRKVIGSMRDRVSFVRDFVKNGRYFFEAPSTYDSEAVRKRWKQETTAALAKLADEFSRLSHPTRKDYEESLKVLAASSGSAAADLIHPLRLALSGVSGGPGVYEIAEILGRDETVARMRTACERITQPGQRNG